MGYKFTFDDGSSAYLMHHGTKGMKWGVWNAETKAKYGMNGTEGAGGGGGGLVDDEYQKELEANSKKNEYPEGMKPSTQQDSITKKPMDILGAAKQKASELKMGASKRFNEVKFRGESAINQLMRGGKRSSNFKTTIQDYSGKSVTNTVHGERLANGRRRSWNTGEKDFDTRPSERKIGKRSSKWSRNPGTFI